MNHMKKADNASNQMTCNHSCSQGCKCNNVVAVENGHRYAVWSGSVFEVTCTTPYVDFGDARYYVPDQGMTSDFRCHPESVARQENQEAVDLATADGNVVSDVNGQMLAQCPITGHVFVVTADSPVRVMDGKCYYFSDTVNLSTVDASSNR